MECITAQLCKLASSVDKQAWTQNGHGFFRFNKKPFVIEVGEARLYIG